MGNRLLILLSAGAIIAALIFFASNPGRWVAAGVFRRVKGNSTLTEQVARYGPAARSRTAPRFAAAHVVYPPTSIVLVALKSERRLELFARGTATDELHWIAAYPILAASGGPGPKRREGDRQVPEGFYRVESLNPNSLYHLSMRINYPSDDDRGRAKPADRTRLGGDIMIHGREVSIGCLAMGDPAIEDLFVLAADIGVENVEVVLAPADLRTVECSAPDDEVAALYLRIKTRLSTLPAARE